MAWSVVAKALDSVNEDILQLRRGWCTYG